MDGLRILDNVSEANTDLIESTIIEPVKISERDLKKNKEEGRSGVCMNLYTVLGLHV